MNTKMIFTISLLSAFFLFSSCGSISYTAVSNGLLASDDTVITAEDGSFTLRPGERFTPPFQSNKVFFDTGSQPLVSDVYKLTNGEYKGFEWKKVRVKSPHHSEELFGVISFCKVQSNCANRPVTKSYRVTVPEEYVDAALGGRVSCVYEYYSCNGTPTIATWVLWLSDAPF